MENQSTTTNKEEVQEVLETSKVKRIGIVAWKIGENSLGITLPYFLFLSSNFDAEVEIILPTHPEPKDIDLLVLPGGPDVDPNRYAPRVSFLTQKSDPIREWFDLNVLPKYIDNYVPIFGIN